jgi:hypothetical protein
MLSVQYLDRAADGITLQYCTIYIIIDNADEFLKKFVESQKLADIYYAYHAIHHYLVIV